MRPPRTPAGIRIISRSPSEASPPSYPHWRDVAAGAGSYLASRRARTVLDMWLAVGSAERPPTRRDLRPESIAGVLADTWLMDYEAATRRLYYRLVGENIRARHDFPLVGRHIGEIIAPEARDRVLPYFQACVEQPAVSIVLGRLYHEWDRPGYGERLLLPLSAPEGKPDGLIGITVCKLTFDSRLEAEERAKRVILVLPLDGSPVVEEVN